MFSKKGKKERTPSKDLEKELADIRHTIKNYLNMLTIAEYEKFGHNEITKKATQYIDSAICVENLET